MPNMNIERLLEKVKAGDSTALKNLYEIYSPLMRDICISITKEDEDTINDLVQDSFILVYYSLGKLQDADKFKSWCATITKNVCFKYLAKKQRMRFVPISPLMDEELNLVSTLTPEEILEGKEMLELIKTLPVGYRKVFRMAVLEGFSHQEIALKLGIGSHSSSSQLARAKAMLRSMLNKRAFAVITIFIICIPLCKYIFWNKTSDGKKSPIVNIKKKPMLTKKLQQVMEEQTPHNHIASNTVYKRKYKTFSDSISQYKEWKEKDTIINVASVIENKDSVSYDTTSIILPYAEKFIANETKEKKKSKWQMIAAGSVGPALAQNVCKIIAGSSSDLPDTDGPIPIMPDEFSTWEDYRNYLKTKEHDGMSADTLALINIAKHNSGEIVEHEHHDKPITFGLSLTKQLNNRWNVETGIQYSLLKSSFTLGEGEYYINRVQKIHYLGIPLKTSYKWLNYKNWSVYSSAGLLVNIPLYGKNCEQYITGTVIPHEDTWHFTPPMQWSVGVGTGVQYQIAPHWGIYLEPTFNWHIPNGSSIHTVWTEHPFTFTIPCGIRFTW